MIYINKTHEPNSLTEYRKTIGSSYKGLPSHTKDELRESLLKDQGYICAYCMKPIHKVNDTKVEHYIPQENANELDYHNLLAVCTGNEGQSAAPFLQRAKTKYENQEKRTAYVGIILNYINKKLQ